MLRTVEFHGVLAERFGKTHRVDADTPYMLGQGLLCQFGQKLGHEFKELVRGMKLHIIKGKNQDKGDVGPEEQHLGLGRSDTIHIMPAVEGSGAAVRIVAGVILLVVSYFFPALAPYLAPMGASLIMGGVAELLTPTPKIGNNATGDRADEKTSFLYNGAVNVMEQGGPIPLIYGRVQRAGSVVISAGLTAEKL